jgi:2-dehydro-3-deoxyphosphogluconate aldolase/(4S)-4-hydroxy-2-oxoglutarate aldolase
MTIDEIMHAAPVIPVLILEQDRDWAALAETFVGAGLPVLEITLRTPLALDAIREMARVPGTIVGAGTVVSERQLEAAIEAGSSFIVSPGITDSLGKAVVRSGVPYLPGIATASDIMRGLDLGLERFKFFPAEASGGITALKALAGPFAGSRFCPTGGIRQETAAAWLSLDPVLCVGGTWLVKPGDSLDAIGERARAAAELRG